MSNEMKREKLTAYVLDELDANERIEINKEIEKDPELKKQLEELEQFCALIDEGLGKEPEVDLSEEQLKALKGEFQESSRKEKKSWFFTWRFFVPAAAVAGLAVLFLLVVPMTFMLGSSEKAEDEIPERRDRLAQLSTQLEQSQKHSPTMDMPKEVKEQLESLGYIMANDGEDLDDLVAGKSGWKDAKNKEDRGESQGGRFNTEGYDRIVENEFLSPRKSPLSTFSIDVDTASYANVRRILNGGSLPPKGAVRIEELINYFSYDYAQPKEGPFSANVEIADAPWNPAHRLVQVGLKGREIPFEDAPNSNLVFLIDTSGSMNSANKIELLKKSMRLLVENLGSMDRVAIVVYAGSAGVVLPSTPANNRNAITGALENLSAGGSTNGGEGIRLAYKIAEQNYIKGGINRVILATDGDFNVGTTNQSDLTRLIEAKRETGVFLTVLGFGMGNYKDDTLEKIADSGNGNYAYIDTLNEAKKVLVHEIGQTLVTIAKDVKIQIEFNPDEVQAYRLIGYENRVLADRDFNDDKKDAGEIGAGHTVTALYEIVPVGVDMKTGSVDPLKYQSTRDKTRDSNSGELCTLKLRYKEPDDHKSKLLEFVIRDGGNTIDNASHDFKHAAAVAVFGMLLRDSKHKGSATFALALGLAETGRGQDRHAYRLEFIGLVKEAARLAQNRN